MVFIIGFATNVERRWSAIVGALNFDSDSWVTSKSNVGAFYALGGVVHLMVLRHARGIHGMMQALGLDAAGGSYGHRREHQGKAVGAQVHE